MIVMKSRIVLIVRRSYNSTRCGFLLNRRFIAKAVIVGVFLPILHTIIHAVINFPLRLMGGVFCRNGCRHLRFPSAKRIAGFSGGADL